MKTLALAAMKEFDSLFSITLYCALFACALKAIREVENSLRGRQNCETSAAADINGDLLREDCWLDGKGWPAMNGGVQTKRRSKRK